MNSKLKLSLATITIAAAGSAVAIVPSRCRKAVDAAVMPAGQPTALTKAFKPAKYAPFKVENTSALTPDFSVLGQEGANKTVWSENFDQGSEGWTFTGTNVEWTTKQMQGDKGFATIDPNDVKSLYVEGPYQTFKREIATATSPEFTVPDNATLDGWIGYSMNYNDYCTLTISASADDFATSVELWSSLNPSDTSKPWAWREVNVSMAALAGQTVRLRLTYGPGTADSFNTGGYMGDFAIDGLSVSGKQAIDHIDVETGDIVTFVDITEGQVASRKWSFPGGTPAESTEKQPQVYYTVDGNYDVTLTVTDAEGKTSSTTRQAFVGVTGSAPVAQILPPATFRSTSSYKYLVAPSVPVTFRDASVGFPTEQAWVFGGTSEESNVMQEIEGPEATVVYHWLHDWPLGLAVANQHGESSALADVSAEFEAEVANVRESDQLSVADVWGGEGKFPGSSPKSLKVTAYGERFSAPSAPVWIPGVNVYFVDAEAGELIDQLASVTVSICTIGPDGFPDRKLNSASWSVFELEKPSSTGLRATQFEFTKPVMVNEPFIVTVEGIPDFREASTTEETGRTLVSFAMAQFRDEGGTAMWCKDGKWQEIADYFPAGSNHTSFMICPYVNHSILTTYPLTDSREITVGPEAGSINKQLYTRFAVEEPEVDADWLTVKRDDPESTLQTATLSFTALPAGEKSRTAHVKFTDGATVMTWTLMQDISAGVALTETDEEGMLEVFPTVVTASFRVSGAAGRVEVYDTAGQRVASAVATDGVAVMDATSWPTGTYIVSLASTSATVKILKK